MVRRPWGHAKNHGWIVRPADNVGRRDRRIGCIDIVDPVKGGGGHHSRMRETGGTGQPRCGHRIGVGGAEAVGEARSLHGHADWPRHGGGQVGPKADGGPGLVQMRGRVEIAGDKDQGSGRDQWGKGGDQGGDFGHSGVRFGLQGPRPPCRKRGSHQGRKDQMSSAGWPPPLPDRKRPAPGFVRHCCQGPPWNRGPARYRSVTQRQNQTGGHAK